MSDIKSIVAILGEDNERKIKDGIADIILEQCKVDLEGWDMYILDPDDLNGVVAEAVDEVRAEIKDMIRDKLMAKAMREMEELGL